MQFNNDYILRLYIDYVNNWLSSTRWMEHHGLNKWEQNFILKKGKSLWRQSSTIK
jgi:hypothetical protein